MHAAAAILSRAVRSTLYRFVGYIAASYTGATNILCVVSPAIIGPRSSSNQTWMMDSSDFDTIQVVCTKFMIMLMIPIVQLICSVVVCFSTARPHCSQCRPL